MKIPRRALQISFVRSGGPGGQNVNKVATKAEVRLSLSEAEWIPAAVLERLRSREKNRITRDGELVVTSSRYRSQFRNLGVCIEKLQSLLERASQKPRVRRPTSPTKASKERRLSTKRARSAKKSRRSWRPDRDE